MKYNAPLGSTDPNAAYINGKPGVQRGSVVTAEALEYPQREIVEVIKQAGLEPKNEELDQLSKAINIIAKNRRANIYYNDTDYYVNMQIWHNNKEYQCLQENGPSTENGIIEPGVAGNEDYWQVFDLENKANVNLDNISDVGKEASASWAMPSSRFVTLGSNTGTAPANGYLYAHGVANIANSYLSVSANNMTIGTVFPSISNTSSVYIPVLKGVNYIINASGVDVVTRRFIYTEGN